MLGRRYIQLLQLAVAPVALITFLIFYRDVHAATDLTTCLQDPSCKPCAAEGVHCTGGNEFWWLNCDPPAECLNVNCTGAGCCTGSQCTGGGPPGGPCFPAGTKVTLQNNSTKNIEDIKAGDRVLSQDESGKQSVSTVQGLVKPVSNNMCTIRYTDGESLDVTKGHPLFTQNGWKAIDVEEALKEDPGVPVTTLHAGDFMTKPDGSWPQVSSISCKNETVQTYNLIVDNTHTYFAGGFLAHNKGTCDSCGADPAFNISSISINASSLTVNWTGSGGLNTACLNNDRYRYLFLIGTSYSAVNGNCGNINLDSITGEYDYRGVGSRIPLGCQAVRVLAQNVHSYTTNPSDIPLSPYTTYYVKIVLRVSYPNNGEGPSGDYCGWDIDPALMNCTMSPTPTIINVGSPATTFTTTAYQSANQVIHPTTVSGVTHTPGTTKIVDQTPEYTPGYFTISGDLGGTGDMPNVKIVKGGHTYYNQATTVNNQEQIVIGEYEMSPHYTGELTATGPNPNITVSYSAPASTAITNKVARVDFSQQNPTPLPNYISISPTSDSAGPSYTTNVTGQQQIASVKLQSKVFVNAGTSTVNASTCQASIRVDQAVASNPWWQVKDADIQSLGRLTSSVPSGELFDLAGNGGYPGVPAYSSTTNLTTTNVSQKGWLANSSQGGTSKIFDYAYFDKQIPTGTTITTIPGNTLTQAMVNACPATGYCWFKFPSGVGALSLNSALNIGTKKVILLMNNNFNINGNISLTTGFFLAVSSGNITINLSVTSLEGLYVADGTISTGSAGAGNDVALNVRGSMAAYTDFNLQRDLTDNSNPAEVFEYAPDQILLFPRVLGTRKIDWKEIAP